MNKSIFKTGLAFFIVVTSLFSCVPSRQYEELKTKNKDCEERIKAIKTENQDMTVKTAELMAKITDMERTIRGLDLDTTSLGNGLRRTKALYEELTNSYDKLLANNEKMLSGKADETRKAISEMQTAQENLQKKEDEVKRMERDLNEKKAKFDELNSKFLERENRVKELEAVLAKKDSTVNALKNTVSNALTGFTGQGLTVYERNGKVYVSMEEQLLFASGSTVVDKKGEEALKQLAKVLEKNPDINVMIEGHTDDVPISGGAIKDNWDLSVLRATSVLKIITKSATINPTRVTAAGRGEYLPLDPGKSAEARKKNRRTEIILTPKLDELLKVLERN
jgi:chemotaxis protein MotB